MIYHHNCWQVSYCGQESCPTVLTPKNKMKLLWLLYLDSEVFLTYSAKYKSKYALINSFRTHRHYKMCSISALVGWEWLLSGELCEFLIETSLLSKTRKCRTWLCYWDFPVTFGGKGPFSYLTMSYNKTLKSGPDCRSWKGGRNSDIRCPSVLLLHEWDS